jgi:predicted ABC-class ATPase
MISEDVVPFESPPSLQACFTLPNLKETIYGMGIPRGITLVCGGGFHGKSTVLQAIQSGIYLKVPGDGREFCVTSARAQKIRAEDGRFVNQVDISPFINNLPFGKDTTCFSTEDASGSTSQAENIIEVRRAALSWRFGVKPSVCSLSAVECVWPPRSRDLLSVTP